MKNTLFNHQKQRLIRRDHRNFVYIGKLKVARYIPERKAIEFKDHHKGGRLVEVSIIDLADGLQRLTEQTNA